MSNVDNTDLEVTLSDIIKAVCERPEVYTIDGTFGEVLAFLDGYANGARLGAPGRSASYFCDFVQWLESRSKIHGPYFWRSFRDSHHYEDEALKQFAELWKIYRKENPASELKER